MSALDQLKRALAAKQRENGQAVTVHVPHPVQYAAPGKHIASDGKPYVITYEEKP